jgi:predicted CopG family antitoxin
MSADKRIPVKEDVWHELAEIKGAGQTYNDLLEELIEARKKSRLAEMVRTRRDSGEFVPLREAFPDEER